MQNRNMEEISRKLKLSGGHRGFVTKTIAQMEEKKDDVLKQRQMENTLKEHMAIIEGLNKEIFEELSKLEKDTENQAHCIIISMDG